MARVTRNAAARDAETDRIAKEWFATVGTDAPADPALTEPTVALARPRSNRGTDATIAANVVALATHAELDYFANAYSYQVKTVGALIGLLATAEGQLADRRLIAPDLIASIYQQIDGLAVQGGVTDEEAGS